ncbi:preprotein translocase subunit SecA [Flexibacter flexilis DSM 6793]|uniref:Protein translocase subunit SecA n=1 Tax=Flexibacter flexilis DSM 6793 TaxID=927664 RepID=A0A1I1DA06_9BACT|nr:preprotein translocase subunit SecA [Flexibacter flexilis]SFB71182.1 preprotein translocase subunit SecA [Flexibacter flexilis DSM 6793]
MLNLITKGITKLFGTKSEQDIKKLLPYVHEVNSQWLLLKNLTDDQLRAKTQEVRNTIDTFLADIDSQIAALHTQIAENPQLDIRSKDGIFKQIDKLELERNKQLEVVLMEVLPVAFAIVKDTARRYKENGSLRVTATDFDREIAGLKSNVVIEGDSAVWHKTWYAAGAEMTWEMQHYDVQIIGGIVLHQGKISEMATGEGKTLVATLPAFLNALAKRGVHIVTVNDYLAKRDSEWMAPLFEFHGLRVDCIDKHEPNSPARRKAYAADITYGTNNEFGFDYLRDNMANSPEELVQRKLHYAMVDEVDSVLIDDARTPLIISGPMARGDQHEFDALKPRVARLVEAQKQLVNQYLIDAKKKIAAGDEKEGGIALFRAYRGLPKNKPLIKYLSETGNKAILNKTESFYLQDNSKMMPEADRPLYFVIDEKHNSIDLTEKGIDFITAGGEDPHFFILPDLGVELGAIEKDKGLPEEDRLALKDRVINEYSEKTQRIHTIQQLLKAYTLFEKDTEYVIMDGKIKIVDEQTGRIMEGRRYSDGLHQALEAKENVKIEDATQTYATVTLQNYFRMYHKLAGMTGTAETEAGEFYQIYKLDVVVIPTNKQISRKDEQDKVYKTMREKFNAVVEEIVTLTKQGRPVLVGTTSVEISEILSRLLKMRGIQHQVLNAKYHQKEAEIVAEAGKSSTVTIATNMAGRGTDIKLTPESKAAGGLAIIGTERHESRRVDRQLRGRSGRQGDPGSSQFFVSLEDNLMRLFGSERIANWMDKMGLEEGEVIQHSMITSSIERAQKKVEENNFGIRKRLLEYDDVMNSQREVIYKRRRNALFGERLQLDVMSIIYSSCDNILENNKPSGDYDNFKLQCMHLYGFNPAISKDEFGRLKQPELLQKLYKEVQSYYNERCRQIAEMTLPVFQQLHQERGELIENIVVPFTDGKFHMQIYVPLKKAIENSGMEVNKALEKYVSLGFIDNAWKEHLREMDDLKQSVQNAVFEQKDPLLVYKFESFNLFKAFINHVNEEIIGFLFKSGIPQEESAPVQQIIQEPVPVRQEPPQRLQLQKEEADSLVRTRVALEDEPEAPAPKQAPVRSDKTDRNERVTVRYANGEIRRDVKYKTVEDDILNNRCVVINLA